MCLIQQWGRNMAKTWPGHRVTKPQDMSDNITQLTFSMVDYIYFRGQVQTQYCLDCVAGARASAVNGGKWWPAFYPRTSWSHQRLLQLKRFQHQ